MMLTEKQSAVIKGVIERREERREITKRPVRRPLNDVMLCAPMFGFGFGMGGARLGKASVTIPVISAASLVGVAGNDVSYFTGSNFLTTTAVTVDGISCPFAVLSATRLMVITPPRSAGLKTVTVTNPGGVGTGTNVLRYHDPADSDAMLVFERGRFVGDEWRDRGALGQSLVHTTLYPTDTSQTNLEPRFNEGATNQQLANTNISWLSAISSDRSNYSVTAKVRVRSLPANNATSYLNAGIITDTAAYAGLYVSDTRVVWRHHDGTSEYVAEIGTPLTLNEEHVIDVECNANSIRMRVDGGSWTTPVVAAGGVASAASGFSLKVGQNHDNTKAFVGDISVLQVHRIARGDTWFDYNLDWLRAAYGFRRTANVPEIFQHDDVIDPASKDIAQIKGKGLLLTDAYVENTPTLNVVDALAAVPNADGSNDRLGIALGAQTFFDNNSMSGAVLFCADSAPTPGAAVYESVQLIGSEDYADWGLSFTSEGVRFWRLNSIFSYNSVVVPCTPHVWHLAQFKYDGVNLKLRIDGGPWVSTPCTSAALGSTSTRVGTAHTLSGFFDGLIAEVGLSDLVLSDANFDSWLGGVEYDYGLRLRNATPASFNRATLSFTGFWKPGNYSAGTWTGTASAGTSGGRHLTEATNSPAVYSHAAKRFGLFGALPDFDAVNDHLNLPGNLGTYHSASYSGWALIRPTKLTANNTTATQAYANHGVISSASSAYWCLCVRANGEAVIRHYNSGGSPIEPAAGEIANNVFSLIQWNYDGTTLKIRVNGGDWTSITTTALGGGFAETFQIGKSIDGQPYFPGIIPEVGIKAASLTDAQHDAILASINYDYGLNLAGYAAISLDRSTLSPNVLYKPGNYALGTWTAAVGSNATQGTGANQPRVATNEHATARMPAKTANTTTSSISHPRHDGVDDYQLSSDVDTRNYVSNSALTGGSIGIVFFAYSGGTPQADNGRYNEEGLFSDANGNICVTYSEGVGSAPAGITFSAYNGSVFQGLTLPCTTGEMHYVQVRWNATYREIRLDGGPWKRLTHVVSNIAIATGIFIGKNYTGSYFDGEIFDAMTEKAPWTDAEANDLIAYVNATYGTRFANAGTIGYSPAVRALTMWQKAGNYSAGSWPGTASAGTSATRSFSQGTSGFQPSVVSSVVVPKPCPLVLINASGEAANTNAVMFSNPGAINNNVLWLRPDIADLTLDSSGFITEARDKSGLGDTGRNFANGSPGTWYTPKWNASDMLYNGKPTMGPFNDRASPDVKLLKSGVWSQTYSVFTLGVIGHALQSSNRYFTYEQGTDYNALLNSTGTAVVYSGAADANISSSWRPSGGMPMRAVYAAAFNGGSSGSRSWPEQTIGVAGNLNTHTLGNAGLHVGSYQGDGSLYGVTRLAEVWAFSRRLARHEMRTIRRYRDSYYGKAAAA